MTIAVSIQKTSSEMTDPVEKRTKMLRIPRKTIATIMMPTPVRLPSDLVVGFDVTLSQNSPKDPKFTPPLFSTGVALGAFRAVVDVFVPVAPDILAYSLIR
jgi:hypothetical protein